MKKIILFAFVSLLAGLLACGRPSTSDLFSFDGLGDPKIPEGNIVLGKYAGTVEVSRYRSNYSGWSDLFNTGTLNLQLSAALFNSNAIEGLGGLQLLALYNQPPIRPTAPNADRLGTAGAPPECYFDTGKFAVLGGGIDTVDVGEQFRIEWNGGGSGNRAIIERDPDDAYENPQSDLVFYIGQDGAIPSDEDLEITWEGGTLGYRGYSVAPARDNLGTILHYPATVTGPNGGFVSINDDEALSTVVPEDNSYRIEWLPEPSDNLVGMHIILQVYGPANLGTDDDPSNFDIPWFNEIAELVCLVDDSEGDYTITQETIDQLLNVARTTQAYANVNEDMNGDGVCEPFAAPLPGQPPEGEDGNMNGTCADKIYGVALSVNRRTDNTFSAYLESNVPVYISGNDTAMFKFAAPTN